MRIPIVDQMMSFVRKPDGKPSKSVMPREERIRLAPGQLPLGIALATMDGHWLFVNKPFYETIGYTTEQLARISLHGITHRDDAKKELPLMKKLLAGEIDSYRVEKRLMGRNGRYRSLDVLTAVSRLGGGKSDALIYVVEEPHSVKRHDPGRESERLLAAIVDHLRQVAVIRTDERGIITGWNGGAEEILGYSRDDILGRNRRTLYRDDDALAGKSTQVLKRIEDKSVEQEDWRKRKDGTEVWIHSALSPYRVDGTIRGYVEIITIPPPPRQIDQAPLIEEMRREIDQKRRTEDSLRMALEEMRRVGEETMDELRIMTSALRNEMDRRKAVEEQLLAANQQLSAPLPLPPPIEVEEELEQVTVAEPPKKKWKTIEGTTIEDMLQAHAFGETTGTLLVRSGDREKEIFFENGRVYSCSSNDPDKFLTERLLTKGVITEEQRLRAIEIKRASQLSLGRILLILGAIDEDQLIAAMREKLEDEIADLLTWTEGKYAFVEGDVPALQLVPLRVDVDILLEPPVMYVASSKTRKVHHLSCPSAKRITGAARLELTSPDGFDLCKQCFR